MPCQHSSKVRWMFWARFRLFAFISLHWKLGMTPFKDISLDLYVCGWGRFVEIQIVDLLSQLLNPWASLTCYSARPLLCTTRFLAPSFRTQHKKTSLSEAWAGVSRVQANGKWRESARDSNLFEGRFKFCSLERRYRRNAKFWRDSIPPETVTVVHASSL